jgi:hypothetical protein
MIQRVVTRCLLPPYMSTLNSGGVVRFGKLFVAKQGIDNDKGLVPWGAVRAIQIRSCLIAIDNRAKWLPGPAHWPPGYLISLYSSSGSIES